MSKLVHGIGTNDGKYPAFKDGKPTKEYDLWKHMLHRCTEKNWIKNPTYDNVSCSKNFKHYSFFYEWIHRQAGFGRKDENGRYWNLDKDLLFKSNKLYSEDTCVFVPQRINALLTKGDAARGEYPVGVYWNTNNRKYIAKCSLGASKQTYLGSFDTPQEAFQAYKTFKEALIKEVANEYKNMLDNRVYQALVQYEVEITD